MINIHKQLWVIKGYDRKVEDSDFLLAYMTHREYAKDGSKTDAFNKRIETGISWGRPNERWDRELNKYISVEYNQVDYELEFDNIPVDGFKIVGSVSRWSTSNKLIQVEDPRGFVVEIPTSNLTTLLKHTKVEYGEVMEKCVWGREASNHILLPINSEVYKLAVKQTEQHNNKINLSKLSEGDVVKFSVDGNEYTYLGKGKAVWSLQKRQAKQSKNEVLYYRRFFPTASDSIIEEHPLEDDKYNFIFNGVKKDLGNYSTAYKSSGNCILVRKGKADRKVSDVYAPDRITRKFPRGYSLSQTDGVYYTFEFVKVNWKE